MNNKSFKHINVILLALNENLSIFVTRHGHVETLNSWPFFKNIVDVLKISYVSSMLILLIYLDTGHLAWYICNVAKSQHLLN